jgi:hypothetical protein
MNIRLIIWIIGVFLGVVVLAALWYVMFAPKTVVPQTIVTNPTLPSSGTVQTNSSGGTQGPHTIQTITVTSQSGASVTSKDFLNNGMTIPDEVNKGKYLLAGNLGYCYSDPQKCQAAPANNFSVYYDSVQKSFLIDLTEEPIGQARLDMEQFMLSTLGLPQSEMCSLNYLVSVTRYVNSQFAGKNLGFSFCPGATVLPK